MLIARLLRRALAAATVASFAVGPAAADAYRITGPTVHDNLAVYLIHGESVPGPVPLTLKEAVERGAVRVEETGQVQELQIENTGTEPVFIQAGDIVKGGRQDRVLTVSMLLPPASGRVPIGSFCVEQGRWTARGKEDAKRFASADLALPSREAKIAILKPKADPSTAPLAEPAAPSSGSVAILAGRQARVAAGEADPQAKVWDEVRRTQEKLSGALGASVAAEASRSSLQLSLENDRLKQAQAAYVAALLPAGEKDDDVVGFALAVNGKLASADVYPSNGLFRKMWAKQLHAGVTEALGDKAAAAPTPQIEAVHAFLEAADKGKLAAARGAGVVQLETHDGDAALVVEARRADGAFIHRGYLAK